MPPNENEGLNMEEVGMESSPEDDYDSNQVDDYRFDTNQPTTVGLGLYKVQVPHLPLWGQLLSAMTLLIAITNTFGKGTDHYTYAVSVAVIAMAFGLFGLFLSLRPDIYDQFLFVAPVVGSVTIGSGNSLFLFAWWTIAAGILTFNGPFLTVSFIPRLLLLLSYYSSSTRRDVLPCCIF
jgi:hypothetical protein